MKRFLIILASLLAIVSTLCFSACGTYKPAVPPDNNVNKPGDGNQPGDGDNNGGDNEDNDGVFSATLICKGEVFRPDIEMSAKWNDGTQVHTAAFNSDGVAEISGLDGEYTVTLSEVPDGYTYNANKYNVDNDNRKVEIELYELTEYYGAGTGKYNSIILTKLGAYRLTFTEAGQNIFCEYRPEKSGMYAIESVVDVNANEVNPRLDVYVGHGAWKPDRPNYSLNDGGVSSVFTKNFKYEVSVAGRGPVYSFAIKFDKRSHVELPVDIDFIITRDGDFEVEESTYKVALPQEEFKQTPEYSPFRYEFKKFGTVVGDKTILDGTGVYLSPDDGYYHYAHTDKYGNSVDSILYVRLVLAYTATGDESDALVDFFNDNVRLRVDGKDYTYFIRGYECDEYVTDEHTGLKKKKYSAYLDSLGGDAAKIPPDVAERIKELDYKSYVDYVNTDGLYAVTPEMKNFLYLYSESGGFFGDGIGWGDSNGISSSGKDQWLFACGYYDAR